MPNTTVADLHSDQLFQTHSAIDAVTFGLSDGIPLAGSSGFEPLTVRYEAASDRYTISIPGRTKSFEPSDLSSTDIDGLSYHVIVDDMERDVLMVATQPLRGGAANKYVGYGYWQHDLVEGDDQKGYSQNARLNFFTYGFPTQANAVPRSGHGSWAIDLFGIATTQGGTDLYLLTGPGEFDVDFSSASFSAHVDATSRNGTTDEVMSGATSFWAGGHLVSDGRFAGNATFYNELGQFGGAIQGQFFGPNAEELGAIISATGYRAPGPDVRSEKNFAGVITGQRSNAPPISLTLTNIVSDFSSWSQIVELTTSRRASPPAGGHSVFLGDQENILLRVDGDIVFSSTVFGNFEGTFSSTDLVSRDNRFSVYTKTIDGKPTTLEMFRPGPANSDIALSYASFGRWSTQHTNENSWLIDRFHYFSYGFGTRAGLLMNRSGTARYEGVVHGTGAGGDGVPFEVGGASFFDVDFTNAVYSGAMDLQRLATDGSVAALFGRWDFSDRLHAGSMGRAELQGPAEYQAWGEIHPGFYGPNGEEISALFKIETLAFEGPDSFSIVGATVAKER